MSLGLGMRLSFQADTSTFRGGKYSIHVALRFVLVHACTHLGLSSYMHVALRFVLVHACRT